MTLMQDHNSDQQLRDRSVDQCRLAQGGGIATHSMTIASWTAVISFSTRSIHRIKRIYSRRLGTEKTTSVLCFTGCLTATRIGGPYNGVSRQQCRFKVGPASGSNLTFESQLQVCNGLDDASHRDARAGKSALRFVRRCRSAQIRRSRSQRPAEARLAG